jgi:hypothetical protein
MSSNAKSISANYPSKSNRLINILLFKIAVATSFFRGMSIRKYTVRTKNRARAIERLHGHAPGTAGCGIFREKGAGAKPTIVMGGFVPDSTEAVEFQRSLFKKSGDIYYMNFSRQDFSQERFLAELGDLIEDINSRGERPTLFCISFSCGLVTRFLSDAMLAANLRIAGCVFVSPVMCMEDLVRAAADKRHKRGLLEIILKRILDATEQQHNDLKRHIEKGRRYFRTLVEAGAECRPLTLQHLALRENIMNMINQTTARAGHKRFLSIKTFSIPKRTRPVYDGPVLILVAEREDEIFLPTAPTLAFLEDTGHFHDVFPCGTLRRVTSGIAEDPVAHASLIFHHSCYNPILEQWMLH